ncbi:hypothetical protein ES703_47088 [subsurface metagenome]
MHNPSSERAVTDLVKTPAALTIPPTSVVPGGGPGGGVTLTPVPLKETSTVASSGSFEVIANVADLLPVEVGLKVTLTPAESPAGIVPGYGLIENSSEPGPLIVMLVIVKVAVPTLLTVKV